MKLMDILRALKDKYNQTKTIKYDLKKYKNYCCDSYSNVESCTTYERDILVLGHTIEKGLSHKNIKAKFGIDSANLLAKKLSQYVKVNDINNFVLSNGVSILRKYININESIGVPSNELPKIDFDVDKINKSNVGTYEISKSDFFKNSQESFNILAESRRTVRLYDSTSEPISNDEINEVIRVAQNTPSPCNRQAVRIHIVKDKEKIKQLCDIQKGSNGFGINSGALLVVVSDLRYYTVAERRLPMYDCGSFSMSLVYSAFQKNLGTCILNGSFNETQDRKCKEILGLSDYEIISSFIILNKIVDKESILVAKSERRNLEEIVNYVGE
ncbi:hypothetical protein FYJ26_04550 [Anaerococcus sp. WCA-380-WT-2B]|uniref:Nitroreductase domain-containing protein n=1 Tax=Anaerococcus porci TaxID=2652269 RepID=A0A6N7VUH2_9FIRM|nr:nitroreductase family protein [Anaerococcus porci]MSS77684.1 hypothetical protein [Anaerococcus porci]